MPLREPGQVWQPLPCHRMKLQSHNYFISFHTASLLHIVTLIYSSKFFPSHGNQPIRIDSILISVHVSKQVYFLKPRFMQNIFHFLTGV